MKSSHQNLSLFTSPSANFLTNRENRSSRTNKSNEKFPAPRNCHVLTFLFVWRYARHAASDANCTTLLI